MAVGSKTKYTDFLETRLAESVAESKRYLQKYIDMRMQTYGLIEK